MRIVLFGLGHVGATMAGCLAAAGHRVHGVDRDPAVVAAVASGRAPVGEPGLEGLLSRGVASGLLTVGAAAGDALGRAELAAVCVPTPAGRDGGLDLTAVAAVTEALAAGVRERPAGAAAIVLLYRSTMPPGTADDLLLPLLAAGVGVGPGERYEVAVNPEFLRQGSAVADFLAPARIVLGERRAGATRRAAGLYDAWSAPVLEVPFKVAELAKLADNGWHALKVAFANEVGRAALAVGVEPETVAAVLHADPQRNLGPGYLRPGGPYGGACLGKDLAALVAAGGGAGLGLPVLESVAVSNALHGDWLAAWLGTIVSPPGPVLQVGLSFKPGTDDLRESPLAALARRLRDRGFRLAVYDSDLAPGRLRSACRALGARPCPTRAEALAAATAARLVILGKPAPDLLAALPAAASVVSLTGLSRPQ